MRLQDEAHQTVRPRDFYLAILAVVILLGAMGIYLMETGSVPDVGPIFWIIVLPVVWIVALANFLKYHPRPFPWGQLALLVGYTLFGCTRVMPPGTMFLSWVEAGGVLLMMVGFATRIFRFGKAEAPPTAPAVSDA
jgi:hypothetical protein